MLLPMAKASKTLSTRELFGRNVRLVRRLKEISQEELAGRADIYRSHITLIEKGEINFSVDTMEKVAHALEMEVQDLLEPKIELEKLR